MNKIPYQLVMIIVAQAVDGGVCVKVERWNFHLKSEADAAKGRLVEMNLNTPQIRVSFAIVEDVLVGDHE